MNIDNKEGAAEPAPLLMQDENSGKDGRRYNEWHASRPDARLNAREAAEAAVMPAAPSDAEIMSCFVSTKAEGQGSYMLAVGRAILALSQTMQPQAEPAAGEQAGAVARYSFVCNAGCGVCAVKVMPFEYERTETLEGELLGSKYQPQIVSSCCGAEVHVYDNDADQWGAEVTLAAPGAAIEQEDDTENEWRRLALQFDGHRMQALACIRALLEAPERHAERAREFLAAGPLSGEVVLAQRIAALASPKEAPATPQGETVPKARVEKLAADICAGSGPEESLALVSAFLRECASLTQPTTVQQAETLTQQQREVLSFLYGVGELDGCGFGDRPKGERGLYWWRKHLRAAFPEGMQPGER